MRKLQIELKWAVLFSVMTLAWNLLEKTLGWHDEKIADYYWMTVFFLPFAAFMLYLEMVEKRRRYYIGVIGYRQALRTGIVMSVFVALLSPVAQYITHNYITPEYFVNVKNYSVTNQIMTIETANELFNFNGYMFKSAVGILLGGILSSFIMAFVVQRKVAKLSRKERKKLQAEKLDSKI